MVKRPGIAVRSGPGSESQNAFDGDGPDSERRAQAGFQFYKRNVMRLTAGPELALQVLNEHEFLYACDLAKISIELMSTYSEVLPLNVGTGQTVSIYELARLIKEIVGFDGELITTSSESPTISRRILDTSHFMKMWKQPLTSLDEGIKKTYLSFVDKQHNAL